MHAFSSQPDRLVVLRRESVRIRPGWRPVAALLPTVFPLLLAATSLEVWMGLGQTTAVSSADRLNTWLLITVRLLFWLLAVAILAGLGAFRAAPIAIPLGVPVF